MRRLAFALVALACCGKGSSATDDPGDGGSDPNAEGGTGTFQKGDAGGVVGLPECADATKDVYVIAEDRTFYSFHPPTLTFKAKGILNCPVGGATPSSMAVDRDGVAWVRYSDTSVWKVDTTSLVCADTKFVGPAETFQKFGMGFATETKGGSSEVLYLQDSDGAGLAKFDTKSNTFEYIGQAMGDLQGVTSELTGNGDGKLYGFFITQPAQIAEISKSTGDIVANSNKELTGVYAGDAWAFSFYGGDFYIYTDTPAGNLPKDAAGSDITRYSPTTGKIDILKTHIGFKIVGAGVSTCAPTTPVTR